MNIEIPKCYLNPPTKLDKYAENSYSKVENKESLFGREYAGYRVKWNRHDSQLLNFEVFDQKFVIDSRFKDLIDEINESLYIPDLQEGWDDRGAQIPMEVYKTTIKCVINYSTHILNTHQTIISTPEIKPVRDGSIDLVWNTKVAYLAVNIRNSNDNILGTFFGFKHENKKIKEGELDVINIEPEMAYWMTSLK